MPRAQIERCTDYQAQYTCTAAALACQASLATTNILQYVRMYAMLYVRVGV
jgi:hypothetical protein